MFHHLRSAADPNVIPTHDEQGIIQVTPETGIIFVLIPGGTYWMGAQSTDPDGPNYVRLGSTRRGRRGLQASGER